MESRGRVSQEKRCQTLTNDFTVSSPSTCRSRGPAGETKATQISDQTHWSSTATDTYPIKTASPLTPLAGTPQGESRACRSLFCTGSLKKTV